MSRISYAYQTPTPRFFFNSGYIDPSKESYINRRKFLDWIMNNFYSVPWNRNGICYESFEYSFSIEKAAQEAGMTIKAFEYQLQHFLENKWMSKRTNNIQKRPNTYKFEAEKFSEKIVPLNESNDFQKKIMGGTDLRVETSEKGGTDSKKGEPKGETKGEPIYETKQDKKGEPKGDQKGPFLKNDKESIILSLSKSDNVAKPHAREDLSLSFSNKITAFVNPRSYKLRNGKHLSLHMQNSLRKYSPREELRLLANVQFYEQWVDSGKPIKTNHEAFLQSCINKDYALKREYALKNELYSKFLKAENQAHGIEILKTTVRLKKPDCNEEPQSISIELPPSTFEKILDNYINLYYPSPKEEYAYGNR